MLQREKIVDTTLDRETEKDISTDLAIGCSFFFSPPFTREKKKERQLINKHPEERVFIDVCSGSIPFMEREEGANLLKAIEKGEINYCTYEKVCLTFNSNNLNY